jgi:hypothetical protein
LEPGPITVCIATAVASPYLVDLAGNLVPEFLTDLASPRERLAQLRQRLNLERPGANDDVYRALIDAFWVALLQVVAQEGEAAMRTTGNESEDISG